MLGISLSPTIVRFGHSTLPGRGDISAFTQPIKAGTRLSDPGGMQGWVGLVTYRRSGIIKRCRHEGGALRRPCVPGCNRCFDTSPHGSHTDHAQH